MIHSTQINILVVYSVVWENPQEDSVAGFNSLANSQKRQQIVLAKMGFCDL